mgnify:CR=1 FL=1|jgi:hypothetical protein
MNKLQLHSELLYFFGYDHYIMMHYSKKFYAQTRYRLQYDIVFTKVKNLRESCKNRIKNTEEVMSDNLIQNED